MCAAACLRVGVGAGALELFLLMEKHLNPQSGHHQSEDAHCNGKNYEYCLHSMLINACGSRLLCMAKKYFGLLCRLSFRESSVTLGGGQKSFFCGITLVVLAACDHTLVRCKPILHPCQTEAQHLLNYGIFSNSSSRSSSMVFEKPVCILTILPSRSRMKSVGKA